MKLMHKHFLATIKNIKRLILIIMALSSAAFTAHAQSSSIVIGTQTNKDILNAKGGITSVLASLRKEIKKEKVIASATVYDITGNTSSNLYTSLQASFHFYYSKANNPTQGSPEGFVELYKLEIGASTRSFCIPAGKCASVNIPIQITAKGSTPNSGKGASSGNSMYMVTLSNGNYLQPGEYAFIDKSSLSRDASALYCFSFTVKQ
jgi:hypothetical protein